MEDFCTDCFKVAFIHACNYERIPLNNVSIKGTECAPLIKTWSTGKNELKDVKTDTPKEQRVAPATEPFYSKPI
jgi:hypothetical protein